MAVLIQDICNDCIYVKDCEDAVEHSSDCDDYSEKGNWKMFLKHKMNLIRSLAKDFVKDMTAQQREIAKRHIKETCDEIEDWMEVR